MRTLEQIENLELGFYFIFALQLLKSSRFYNLRIKISSNLNCHIKNFMMSMTKFFTLEFLEDYVTFCSD